VSAPIDPSPKFAQYANPNRLVSTQWVQENLNTPGVVIVESNEDVLLYETGHIPGAVKIDWHTDLNHPVTRDYVDGSGFAQLCSAKGISRDDTVVIYGDMSNWWAAYALWVFTLFGHEDVRLMDGGRDAWINEGRELTREVPNREATQYPVIERDDTTIRAFKAQVLDAIGKEPLIDVRSPDEFAGRRTTAPHYPEEGSLRAGHIPTAQSVPWGTAAQEDGRFKPRSELEQIYVDDLQLDRTKPVIAYCRIGERSAHTWFVLHFLLGFEAVRNYDGSWTEWGSAVGVPIERKDDPEAA